MAAAAGILSCHDSRVAFAAAAVDVLQNNLSGLAMDRATTPGPVVVSRVE
jgi:riboflavin synthase